MTGVDCTFFELILMAILIILIDGFRAIFIAHEENKKDDEHGD